MHATEQDEILRGWWSVRKESLKMVGGAWGSGGWRLVLELHNIPSPAWIYTCLDFLNIAFTCHVQAKVNNNNNSNITIITASHNFNDIDNLMLNLSLQWRPFSLLVIIINRISYAVLISFQCWKKVHHSLVSFWDNNLLLPLLLWHKCINVNSL